MTDKKTEKKPDGPTPAQEALADYLKQADQAANGK